MPAPAPSSASGGGDGAPASGATRRGAAQPASRRQSSVVKRKNAAKPKSKLSQMSKASLVYIIQFRFSQFATNGQMKKGGKQADYGTLSFGLSAAASPFIRISDATVAGRLLLYCETKWRLPKARALVSIIGGAADFNVGERLLEAFSDGLSKAAKQVGLTHCASDQISQAPRDSLPLRTVPLSGDLLVCRTGGRMGNLRRDQLRRDEGRRQRVCGRHGPRNGAARDCAVGLHPSPRYDG